MSDRIQNIFNGLLGMFTQDPSRVPIIDKGTYPNVPNVVPTVVPRDLTRVERLNTPIQPPIDISPTPLPTPTVPRDVERDAMEQTILNRANQPSGVVPLSTGSGVTATPMSGQANIPAYPGRPLHDYTDFDMLTPKGQQEYGGDSFGRNMPTTPSVPIDISDKLIPPTREQGLLGKMTGAISDFVYPDGEVNWGLVAGLNQMTMKPDPSISAMAAEGMKQQRKTSDINKSVRLLRQKATDHTVDETTRQKIFHSLDMIESNPDLADDLIKDALSLLTGQTDPSDIKVYEPRVDESTGEVYIPQLNKATGQIEKKWLNVKELTKKQKIELEINEELRGKDLERQQEAYQTTFIKAQNLGDNIRSLEGLIAELDKGATTGFVANWLPTLKHQTAMFKQISNQLGLDIVGSVTFGALSEKELALAMETAVPPNLGPAEMKKWAIKRIQARQKLQQELLRRVDALGKADSYKDFLQGEADLQQRHINANWWRLKDEEQNALVKSGVNYNLWQEYNLADREEALLQLRK